MQKTILLQKKKPEVQLEENVEEDDIKKHLEATLADAKAGRIRRVR